MGEALYLLNCLICYLSSDITMLMGLCEFCEFFYALFLYLVTKPNFMVCMGCPCCEAREICIPG